MVKRVLQIAGKLLVPILVCVGAVFVLGAGLSGIESRTDEEGFRILEEAIMRVTVQCYAIEGRYPPSIAYLEENYGLQIDRTRYTVFYNIFADNLLPDITILSATD